MAVAAYLAVVFVVIAWRYWQGPAIEPLPAVDPFEDLEDGDIETIFGGKAFSDGIER